MEVSASLLVYATIALAVGLSGVILLIRKVANLESKTSELYTIVRSISIRLATISGILQGLERRQRKFDSEDDQPENPFRKRGA